MCAQGNHLSVCAKPVRRLVLAHFFIFFVNAFQNFGASLLLCLATSPPLAGCPQRARLTEVDREAGEPAARERDPHKKAEAAAPHQPPGQLVERPLHHTMDVGALIYAAAYHGQIRQLKKLLAQCGPSTNYLSWRHPHGGAMAIYVACEFDHYDAVKMLLNAGAPVDAARDDGATPLYLACRDGKLDIVSLLLERGADVNRVDGNQMNALWVACHQGRTDLAKILLEARADPLHRVEGWSPVMLAERLAREQGRYDLMDALEPFLPGGARATAPSAAGSSSAAASAAGSSSSSSSSCVCAAAAAAGASSSGAFGWRKSMAGIARGQPWFSPVRALG